MIGTSEAMNLGQNLGLDPKLLAEVISKSTGRCWSSDLYNPCPGVLENVPSSNNYQGGFGTALMTKVKKYCLGLKYHFMYSSCTGTKRYKMFPLHATIQIFCVCKLYNILLHHCGTCIPLRHSFHIL